jgi:hypothetical protein
VQVTNDIFWEDGGEFLVKHGALPEDQMLPSCSYTLGEPHEHGSSWGAIKLVQSWFTFYESWGGCLIEFQTWMFIIIHIIMSYWSISYKFHSNARDNHLVSNKIKNIIASYQHATELLSLWDAQISQRNQERWTVRAHWRVPRPICETPPSAAHWRGLAAFWLAAWCPPSFRWGFGGVRGLSPVFF